MTTVRSALRYVIYGVVLVLLTTQDSHAQRAPATSAIFTLTIHINVIEIKGATTTDKLTVPSVNPAELSKGYGYKAPGQADKTAPQRWEVSSYLFTPAFVATLRGATVLLNVFVVNGDEHEIRILAPDGQEVMPKTVWHRGREYRVSFTAAKVGPYVVSCATHAPTMTATVLVLPR
jgi:plastocyanin